MIRPFLQFIDAVIAPLGESRDEFDTYTRIVQRMGIGAPSKSKLRSALGKLGWVLRPLTLIDIGLRLGPVGHRFGARRSGCSLKKLRRHPHGAMADVPHPSVIWRRRFAWPDRKIHVWYEVIAAEFAHLFADKAPVPRFRLLSIREIQSLNSWTHNVDRLDRSRRPA